MTPEDLFVETAEDGYPATRFNATLIEELRRGPRSRYTDTDAATQLVYLIEAELTGGEYNERLGSLEVAAVLRCLDAVLGRLGVRTRLPFGTKRGFLSLESPTDRLVELCGTILRELSDREREASRSGFRGVAGDLRNLVFAVRHGKKLDIVWTDFARGEFTIKENVEHCLIYNRPIPETGLTMADVLAWWAVQDGIHSQPPRDQAAKLKARFEESLSPKSPIELQFFRFYWALAERQGFECTPAILPQVYLHYDPKTREYREATGGAIFSVQCRDFMLLGPGSRRIVLEVDGKTHYTDDTGAPSPRTYATFAKQDRSLRLQGYEVFRFGGYEFQPGQALSKMLTDFFDLLLTDG